jgi:hypothetical protein
MRLKPPYFFKIGYGGRGSCALFLIHTQRRLLDGGFYVPKVAVSRMGGAVALP